MHRILLATSALLLLGGNASFAQDFGRPFAFLDRGYQAADDFAPSDQNDMPPRANMFEPFDNEIVTGSITAGPSVSPSAVPLYDTDQAADNVRPSDPSDFSEPPAGYQPELGDTGFTTDDVTTGSVRSPMFPFYRGYNASDSFGPS